MIMLDADNTPLKNPEVLFDSKEYREGGNLYWPDWWDAQGWLRPAAYTLFGITPPWTVEGGEGFRTAESGQMVLNRRACFHFTIRDLRLLLVTGLLPKLQRCPHLAAVSSCRTSLSCMLLTL